MGTVIEDLSARAGAYGGHGINNEDQPFHGELSLTPLPAEAGTLLQFRATGIDGTEYHVERTWIAADDTGELGLWTISSSTPHVSRLRLRRSFPTDGTDRTLVFGTGDEADPSTFRCEITLELWPDGTLGYRYAWALPGDPSGAYSEVRVRPAAAADDATGEEEPHTFS